MSRNPEDERLVREALATVQQHSQTRAAKIIGVSQTDMSRFRRDDWEWLTDAKRQALRDYLRRVQKGPPLVDAGGPDNLTAEELFGGLDRIAKFLGGFGAGELAKARKLDALEGIRRVMTARAGIPDWFYELKTRIEGESDEPRDTQGASFKGKGDLDRLPPPPGMEEPVRREPRAGRRSGEEPENEEERGEV